MKKLLQKKWFRGLLLLLAFYLLVKLYNQDLLHEPVSRSEPIWIAHRGASAYAPENTLAAFQEALDRGAAMIELDVHLSQDGQVVVIHDATLARTTSGTGAVRDYPWSALRELDAGSWFDPEFADQRIPLLQEVLGLIAGKSRVLIELKWPESGAYPGLEDSVLAIIDRYQARPWCEIQSFDAGIVRRFRSLAPEMTIQKLIFLDLPLLPGHIDRQWQWTEGSQFDADIDGINPSILFLSPRLVNRIHTQGKRVYVYTANRKLQQEKCRRLGVDGIISDGVLFSE